MDNEMNAEVRSAIRDLIGSVDGPLDRQELDDWGWLELYEEDQEIAVSALFDELGKAGRPSNALDMLLAESVYPDVEEPIAFLHPFANSLTSGTLDGDSVEADGILLKGAENSKLFAVTVADGETSRNVLISSEPSSALTTVSGNDPQSEYLHFATAGTSVVRESNFSSTYVAIARRALAMELLGIATSMLEIASEHVTSREQFGRPLGTNQSVRHRLADTHVAIESARSAFEFSWSAPEEDFEMVSALCKSLASTAYQVATKHCLQVTGGMGFTNEFPLGALVRRGSILDALYGDTRTISKEIGNKIIRNNIVRLSSK